MEFLTVSFSGKAPENVFEAYGELPENHFRGVASVFGGIVDAYVPTILHPGAFKKTLQESVRKVVLLWQHDAAEPIGKPVHMFESEEGLALEGSISLTTRGRDALTLMRDGVMDAMSIGFDPIKEELVKLEDNTYVRHIREVRLWEVSLVTWGADSAARIREVNSNPAAKAISKYGVNPGKLEVQSVQRFQDLPLADLHMEWSSEEASQSLFPWSSNLDTPRSKYARAYVVDHPTEGCKLPIAGLVEGELQVIPGLVFGTAMQIMRKTVELTAEEEAEAKAHLEKYFAKMAQEFQDESIVAPWATQSLDFPGFDAQDKLFLLGQHLYALSVKTSVSAEEIAEVQEALSNVLQAESPQALTADVDSLLLDADLAMRQMLLS